MSEEEAGRVYDKTLEAADDILEHDHAVEAAKVVYRATRKHARETLRKAVADERMDRSQGTGQ